MNKRGTENNDVRDKVGAKPTKKRKTVNTADRDGAVIALEAKSNTTIPRRNVKWKTKDADAQGEEFKDGRRRRRRV